ncbi:hypothetical protein BG841_14270 [Marinobacter sp. X15-166B]|nr:hypothetical protein BG841_14270 [Marinobacter sp. X15-166B]
MGPFIAVNKVSLDIADGEVLAIVGESGCGKSTLSRLLIGLDQADGGEIRFNDRVLYRASDAHASHRNDGIAIVFQDPFSSLNPKMRVVDLVAEAFRPTKLSAIKGWRGRRVTRRKRVVEYLNLVGLDETHLDRFPHEFSGGQLQRIALARALAQEPGLLILDEPTAALDVSVQAQILMLLKELQQRLALSMVFISHNLGSVAFIADRIMVMYLGHRVEAGPTRKVLDHTRHHYTRALIEAVPSINPHRKRRVSTLVPRGSILRPASRSCVFADRCPAATDDCRQHAPSFTEGPGGHGFACFHPLSETQP